MTREDLLVELVDPDGAALGSATVADAHDSPGLLHRAFSVLLVDPAGRLLLQQRSAAKTRFALRWTNACCGHPEPGEAVPSAAARRLEQELGLRAVGLTGVGVYRYDAPDPATLRVEREYDHVLVGMIAADTPLRLDPAEVAAVRWSHPAEVSTQLADEPQTFTPWLAGVLAVWRSSGL